MVLPDELLQRVEFAPVEDVLVPILRDELPGIRVTSLVNFDTIQFPAVLVRASYSTAHWSGHPDLFDESLVSVQVFTDGLDADQDGAHLSEVVRVALRDAARRRANVPGVGRLVAADQRGRARRQPDWATATGPVQYADLPSGAVRYESIFHVRWREPRT